MCATRKTANKKQEGRLMKGLTGKQKKIVEIIEDFNRTMGMAPTIYEIAEHFGIKTSTVFAHIRALQKKNILHRSSKARSISLAHPKHHRRTTMPAGAQSVPVCGTEGANVICDTKLFNRSIGEKDIFAMRVKGSDMTGMGIMEGDMLLLKSPAGTVTAGDLLITEQNGKTALCSCVRNENGTCELKGHGKHIFMDQRDLPLKGIVIGLQRSL